MKHTINILLVSCFLLLSALSARADILFGNLTGYTNDSWVSNQSSTTGGKEMGFTTGNSPCTLTDVVLRLNVGASTNVPLVYLYTGGTTGGTPHAPTTLQATFRNPTFTYGTTQNYVFTLDTPALLAPNTPYWIAVQCSGSTPTFAWYSGGPTVAYTGTDMVSSSVLMGPTNVGPTGWTNTSSVDNWLQADGGTTYWRIGIKNQNTSEFTGSTMPISYTIPSNWATQTTWPQFPAHADNRTWTTDIYYTLPSVPAGGAIFTFEASWAMQLVPEVAVYSNGNPCGVLQIPGCSGLGWGTYSHERNFWRPLQLYIPKEFLMGGNNTLHLARLPHPYSSDKTNVAYSNFNIDFMQMDGLATAPAEPIHGKMVHMGITEGSLAQVDNVTAGAQDLNEWLGVAYSGNPVRAAFWSDCAPPLSSGSANLLKMQSLNMSVVLDGLNCKNTGTNSVPLSSGTQAIIQGYLTHYGSLVQFYELCNEPCQPITNAANVFCTAVANYINTIKPANVTLTAPGYAFGGGSGTPLNWDDGSSTGESNRKALDALCGAYAGHSYGSPGWGMDNGDLAETCDADGTWVMFNGTLLPQFTNGFDKPFVSTECGSGDTLYENISQIPNVYKYAAALDRNLRANTTFCDYMLAYSAFGSDYNYRYLEGTNSTSSTWATHMCGPDPIPKIQVFRRLALAYSTHGSPLPFTYSGISGYPLIYFRAVDTSTLLPLPGSGATANKVLLNFVNFDYFNSNTISVTVTMPRNGTYTGVCYGAGNSIAAAKSTVSLTTDSSNNLTITLTLLPGESTQYILNP